MWKCIDCLAGIHTESMHVDLPAVPVALSAARSLMYARVMSLRGQADAEQRSLPRFAYGSYFQVCMAVCMRKDG